jgi:hypothetical protein
MNILAAVKYGLEALRVGKSLVNVAAWKEAQGITSFLVAAVAVVMAFGVDFGIDDSTLAAAGVAIAALVNTYLTFATSKQVGLPDKFPPTLDPPDVDEPVNPHIERRMAHHIAMRDPIIPPADIGYNRARFDERVSDNKPDGVERRGQPDLDAAKDDQPVSESGWNDR